jgi:hypothetical protein
MRLPGKGPGVGALDHEDAVSRRFGDDPGAERDLRLLQVLVHVPTMLRDGGCVKRAEVCPDLPPSASIGDANGMAAEGDKTGSGLAKSRSLAGAMAEMPRSPPAGVVSDLGGALTSVSKTPSWERRREGFHHYPIGPEGAAASAPHCAPFDTRIVCANARGATGG